MKRYALIAPMLILTLQAVPMLQLSAQAASKPTPASMSKVRPKAQRPFILEDGEIVRLRFREDISSKTAQPDQPVYLQVAEDVFLDGRLIIQEGAPAKGVVREVQKSGMLGKKGKLDIQVRQVTLVTGEKIKLRAARENGGSVSGGVIAAAAIVNPLFLLIKGKNVTYQAGAEFDAYVAEDYELDPNAFVKAR